jgi:uncharacterized lipoprotein YehR (DUF1307 family)
MKLDKLFVVAVASLLAVGLSGCGDTWSGLKKDTGDNMEATGEAIEKAGKEVKN